MTRALWFFVKLAILIGIAIWLVERPGTVTVDWQGYIVQVPFGFAVLGLAVAIALAALIYRFWRGVRRAPGSFGRWRGASRRDRGYRALTKGMVAVAAGDAAAARRFAREADNFLHDRPLTMLLSAQAAQLSGDDKAAERYFHAMLDKPETAFLGVRGLLNQAIRNGDRAEALDLARKAKALQPQTPWVLTTLFDLEAKAGQWERAEWTLLEAIKHGAVPAETGRRHRAALLVERSYEAELEGRHEAAFNFAKAAFDVQADFVPGTVRYARLLTRIGKGRRAAKVVEKGWQAKAHPDLAEAYREIAPDADALAQVKRFERLLSIAPDSNEGHLALARIALDAGLWGEARNHLNQALQRNANSRVYRMLAELAEKEHGDTSTARDWLNRAAMAEPDPAWVCQACGTAYKSWRSVCTTCGEFNGLTWKVPTAPIALSESLPAPATVAGVTVATPAGNGSANGEEPAKKPATTLNGAGTVQTPADTAPSSQSQASQPAAP
jgi:HemY protein